MCNNHNDTFIAYFILLSTKFAIRALHGDPETLMDDADLGSLVLINMAPTDDSCIYYACVSLEWPNYWNQNFIASSSLGA